MKKRLWIEWVGAFFLGDAEDASNGGFVVEISEEDSRQVADAFASFDRALSTLRRLYDAAEADHHGTSS